MDCGDVFMGIVATTVCVSVSITEIEAEPVFATYTREPSGCAVTPAGLVPTGTVAITVFVPRSMTDTLLLPPLAMNATCELVGAPAIGGITRSSIHARPSQKQPASALKKRHL